MVGGKWSIWGLVVSSLAIVPVSGVDDAFAKDKIKIAFVGPLTGSNSQTELRMSTDLHAKAIVIDGLIISDFSRAIFEDMRKGGLTAANCTCCVWEGFTETMRNVARWKKLLRDNSDLITQVYTTADIVRAKSEGKTGIILGWQNVTGIEDQLGYLQLFKELGIGIIQMAYNTQNMVGTGCYESRDAGLSDFGREVVADGAARGSAGPHVPAGAAVRHPVPVVLPPRATREPDGGRT